MLMFTARRLLAKYVTSRTIIVSGHIDLSNILIFHPKLENVRKLLLVVVTQTPFMPMSR